MINQVRYADAAALVGRLFFSSLFLAFSYGKLTAFGDTSGYMASLGLPAPALFTSLAIIIEIGGGLLMLVGYETRLLRADFCFYRTLAPWRPESIPALYEEHGAHRRFAGICCSRRRRLFARRTTPYSCEPELTSNCQVVS